MVNKYQSGTSDALDHKKVEAGTLGKFLGMGDNALKNVIGIIAIVLTIIMLVLVVSLPIFENLENSILTALTVITPLFTLVIGYLAGVIKK